METVQYTHAREIAAERETKAFLNTKVNGLAEYVEKVEEERDELRDVVLALVEKGGCSLVAQGRRLVMVQLLPSLIYLISPQRRFQMTTLYGRTLAYGYLTPSVRPYAITM